MLNPLNGPETVHSLKWLKSPAGQTSASPPVVVVVVEFVDLELVVVVGGAVRARRHGCPLLVSPFWAALLRASLVLCLTRRCPFPARRSCGSVRRVRAGRSSFLVLRGSSAFARELFPKEGGFKLMRQSSQRAARGTVTRGRRKSASWCRFSWDGSGSLFNINYSILPATIPRQVPVAAARSRSLGTPPQAGRSVPAAPAVRVPLLPRLHLQDVQHHVVVSLLRVLFKLYEICV